NCVRRAFKVAGWSHCGAGGRRRDRADRPCIPWTLHMTKLVSGLVLVLLVASTDAALAHAPLMGIGGVTGGVLHAVLIPEHGMSLVALGLVIGRQERSARRSGELFFVAAL